MHHNEQAPPSKQRLITPDETASLLCTTTGTLSVWRSTNRYQLHFIKIGRLVRYKREDVDAFIERRRMEHTGKEAA